MVSDFSINLHYSVKTMEAENIDIEHLEGLGNDKFKLVEEDEVNFMKNNVYNI